MSSASQNTQGDREQIDVALPPTPPQQLTPPNRTPPLTPNNREITAREDLLLDWIDTLIRQFLTRPDHQSPYRFSFRWTVDDGATLQYRFNLTIQERSM
ncbi:unnamed protein product [Rotaria magnacalcarata]|uniref:Uncharacterized protein n=1 Tax=Rotaria magnacalcarata TaxID=392030 RepID=A0A816PUD3_9BILA|nr:unnamed protein product [Rotaria magnacalcarata]CAF1675987.1 unnamed protein product [Rotaria magnacalcarata]CAF1976702.1 unnamed protein product [Rotaria magnacalcarata]CAF2033063.1 unnamed protein product [Rotaria magnacalcarata]CAF2052262.1 unnamed protein product [Rotaria magnacalcarata]